MLWIILCFMSMSRKANKFTFSKIFPFVAVKERRVIYYLLEIQGEDNVITGHVLVTAVASVPPHSNRINKRLSPQNNLGRKVQINDRFNTLNVT